MMYIYGWVQWYVEPTCVCDRFNRENVVSRAGHKCWTTDVKVSEFITRAKMSRQKCVADLVATTFRQLLEPDVSSILWKKEWSLASGKRCAVDRFCWEWVLADVLGRRFWSGVPWRPNLNCRRTFQSAVPLLHSIRNALWSRKGWYVCNVTNRTSCCSDFFGRPSCECCRRVSLGSSSLYAHVIEVGPN